MPNNNIPAIVQRAIDDHVTDIGQLSKQEIYALNLYASKKKSFVLIKGKSWSFPIPKTAWTHNGFINFIPNNIDQLSEDF